MRYVAILYEMIDDARVIPIDGRLRVFEDAKTYVASGFSASEEIQRRPPRPRSPQREAQGIPGDLCVLCGYASHFFKRLSRWTRRTARGRKGQALMPRVTLRANPTFDAAAPLSQAQVTVRLLKAARW